MTFEERVIKEFREKFGHSEECRSVLYGDNEGCVCQVEDFRDFLLSALSRTREEVLEEVVEKIKALRKEITEKEGEVLKYWSETGKVAYYYLSEVEQIIKQIAE